jgi:hypothetical protein
LGFIRIVHIFSLFNLGFFRIFHIFSLFNLPFFHIVHILSLFNLPFFHIFHIFLAHLTQRVMWAIAITWRPSSVCKLFKKSSSLKPQGQFKTNLAWIILRGFPLKDISDDTADQPSWPPCL